MMVDVSALEAAKQTIAIADVELANRQMFTDSLLATAGAGIIACDRFGKLTVTNRTARSWHGLDPDVEPTPEQLARLSADLLEADGVTPLALGNNALRRAFNEGTTWKGEMVIAPAGGQKVRVMATASPLRDPEGVQVGAVATMHDITLLHQRESALHRVEQQLADVALHDRLTGVPNRTLFADRLAKTLARTGRSGHQLAVLFCDLDGFAAVNDTGGQNAGDAVLEATAKRLVAILRAEDTAARVGADEFVLILEPSSRVWTGPDGEPIDVRAYAIEVAGRIEAALAVPVEFDGQEYAVTVSIGLAFAQAGDDGEEVVAQAEAAMYRAKSLGKDRHEISTEWRSAPVR